MLRAAELGARLFRNNSGRMKTETGRWVQFGVPPKGGADLVGWVSVEITPDMVGQQVAVFTALEIKAGADKLMEHQQNFLSTLHSAGGIAGIVRSTEDVETALTRGPVNVAADEPPGHKLP